MNATANMVAENAARLFAKTCDVETLDAAEAGTWQAELWSSCEELGLSLAGLPDDDGHIDLQVVAAVVRTAAHYSVPLSLAETILAQMQLHHAGLPTPSGPLTVGPALRKTRLTLKPDGADWRISGQLDRIPWARNAAAIVLVVEDEDGWRTCVLEPQLDGHGSNLARELRDRVVFDDVLVPAQSVGELRRGWQAQELWKWGALMRAIAMSGALDRVLELTVDYAGTRVQFGRPIGKFQAVQQQIAVLASHVAAARAAVGAILAAAPGSPMTFEIAAAKCRVGEAATAASEIAHQVHGAMGFTYEHSLHRSTRRLLSWREEFGSESEWAIWMGRVACATGGAKLWPLITDADKHLPDVPSILRTLA